MADDSVPGRDVTAALDGLHKSAESTGKKVRDALEEGLSPAVSHPAFLSFDSESFKVESPDGPSNILQDVKDRFEDIFQAQVGGDNAFHRGRVAYNIFQDSKRSHAPGTINWRRVLFILAPTSFNENTYSSKPGDPWVLALFVGEEDRNKVGRSFSLRENFRVKKGDIYLAFTVSRD